MLLDSNPLVHIRNTKRIVAVLLRGRVFDRGQLAELMEAVQAMPDIRVIDWTR